MEREEIFRSSARLIANRVSQTLRAEEVDRVVGGMRPAAVSSEPRRARLRAGGAQAIAHTLRPESTRAGVEASVAATPRGGALPRR